MDIRGKDPRYESPSIPSSFLPFFHNGDLCELGWLSLGTVPLAQVLSLHGTFLSTGFGQAGGYNRKTPGRAVLQWSDVCLPRALSTGTTANSTPHVPGVMASTSPSASGGCCCVTGPLGPPRRLHQPQSRNQAAQHMAPIVCCSRRAPSLRPPPHPTPRPSLLSPGNWPSMGTRMASADVSNKPREPPLGDRTSQLQN